MFKSFEGCPRKKRSHQGMAYIMTIYLTPTFLTCKAAPSRNLSVSRSGHANMKFAKKLLIRFDNLLSEYIFYIYSNDINESSEDPAPDIDNETNPICDQETVDPEFVNNQEVAVYSESYMPLDSSEDVYVVCKLEVSCPSTTENDDFEVDTLRSMPVDKTENVYTYDVCDPEASDLEQINNQDFLVCTEIPMPVDSTVNLFTSEICGSEPGDIVESSDFPITVDSTGNLFTSDICGAEADVLFESSDIDECTETLAPGDYTETVYAYVYDPEACDVEVSDNPDSLVFSECSPSVEESRHVYDSDADKSIYQDLLECTENPASVDDSDNVCNSDVCYPEAGYQVFDQDVQLYTESHPPVGDMDIVYTSKICDHDGDLERAEHQDVFEYTAYPEIPGSETIENDFNMSSSAEHDLEAQKLPICTESLATVDALDNVCTSDVDEPEGRDVIHNQGVEVCIESPAPVDSADKIYIGDDSDPEGWDLEGADNQDVEVCTESPAPVDSADNMYIDYDSDPEPGDLEGAGLTFNTECQETLSNVEDVHYTDFFEKETSSQESWKNQELAVNTESQAVDKTDNVFTSDVCEPEADLERVADQHQPVCSVPQAEVDNTDRVHINDICDPDTGNLESVANQDLSTESPAAVVGTDIVYSSDAYDSEYGNIEQADNPDLPMCTENSASFDDAVYTSDVCNPVTGVDCKEIPVTPESPTSLDNMDSVCTSGVCEPEADNLERVFNQDQPVCSVPPNEVDNTDCVCTNDVCNPDTCNVESDANQGILCPVPELGTDSLYMSELYEPEGDDLENVDNEGSAIPSHCLVSCLPVIAEKNLGAHQENRSA
ncbi:tudor domain-containing 6-like [Pelobates fuscus]|uniref:tudor domain-containing 6-like n=1 Tax=Pelobates fuscus TaxID=191477 RepID=UPI002FE4BBAB